jgi:hypothetical protein
MSYNLGDMMPVRCAFHSTGHARAVCVGAVGRSDAGGAAAAVAAAAVPARACVLAGVQFAEAVVGSVTVTAVADMEFQYLQVDKINTQMINGEKKPLRKTFIYLFFGELRK